MKQKTNISVKNNLGYHITSSMEIGPADNGYTSGDILDANATIDVIKDLVDEISDGAASALDRIEQLENSIPTKVSDLLNDSGFITSSDVNVFSGDYNDLTNKPTIPTVPTNISSFTNDAGYTTNTGTVTGIIMNGESKGTSGVIDLGTVLTSHQDISGKVNYEEFEQLISDLDGGGYGIKVVNYGTPTRIGNMVMHKTLPIQNRMRRCTVKNGSVYKYISDIDPTKYTDGTDAHYDGTDGDVMVEIPEYYYQSYRYTDDNNNTVDILMLYPYSNTGRKSKKVYIGAFEAASDGSKLYSICTTNFTVTNNAVDMSELTYTDNATTYRGGNNSATNDSNINSLLGRPVSNLTRAVFRTRAAAKGTGYSQQYWSAYMSMVRLYVVEYASFNSQAAFNSTLTADRFKQGGLGSGVTTAADATWNTFNGKYAMIPCGITKGLGNSTGYIECTYPENTYTTTSTTFTVPSYRGVENPFGNITKWTDGININSASGTTTVYTTEDITKFADNTSTGYESRVSFATPASNTYIKEWNWDEHGDFLPVAVGGTDNSYLYDYSYWASGWRVLSSGGAAPSAATAGLFSFLAHLGSGAAYPTIGSRLYFTPSE